MKLAAHPDGKHFLALTSDGGVHSWGSGDGGRLGHGDSNSRDEPTLIEALDGKHMVHIACGSTYRSDNVLCTLEQDLLVNFESCLCIEH